MYFPHAFRKSFLPSILNSASSLATSASTASGTVLPFTAVTGVSVGQTVSGTNIAAGTTVVSFTSTSVTLSTAITGTVASGATISFAQSLALAAGSSTTPSLVAGQIGIFAKTSPNNSSLVATVTPSTTPFIIAQGSYFGHDKIGPVHGGYQETVKSKLINPHYVSRVMTISARKPVQQVIKVVAANSILVDSTYRLRIDVKGSPALRFLNHQIYKTLDAYTGCAGTNLANIYRDVVPTLLAWKDQINSSLILNQMVQARVYLLNSAAGTSGTATATNVASITTTSAVITVTNTGMNLGDLVVGAGIPANAYITGKTSTTAITITFPTQAVAPTISTTVAFKVYLDVYTSAGDLLLIPGTGSVTGLGAASVTSPGVSSTGVVGATSSVYTSAISDASASFTQDAFIQLTAAYAETTFGQCTFTPTDKYELEPLILYAAVLDESGNPCYNNPFVANTNAVSQSNPYLSSHGIEVQAAVQASGYNQTVLRELILDGRYLQNAFPDSSRVESFRMREIEADPALSQVLNNSYYDKVLVLHNVPRFNNPTSSFDNDQYLIVINVPTGVSTTALTNFIVNSANISQGVGTIVLEQY